METAINERLKVEVEFSDNTVRIDDYYNDGLIVWSLEEFEKIVEVVKSLTNC